MRPSAVGACSISATAPHALAAANAAKHNAMTHPCRPSAYWLIMVRDGWISGLRTCSAARATSARAAAPIAARAASTEYVIASWAIGLFWQAGRDGLASPHALNRLRHRLLERAPAGWNPVRRPVEDRLDTANLTVLDLEQLPELPRPVDLLVIEEREGEHDPALAIDGHEAAIADPRHHASQRVLELRLAVPLCRRDAVLEALAVVGERVIALAVVASETGEVVVRGLDTLVPHRQLRVR